MNISFRKGFLALAMAGLCSLAWVAQAQEPQSPSPPIEVEAPNPPRAATAPGNTPNVEAPDVEASDAADTPDTPDAADAADTNDADTPQQGAPRYRWSRDHRNHRHNGNERVVVGGNSTLEAGQQADSVVSVFGSSTSAGTAGDVVSVAGDTRVTGSAHDTVAVLGSVYLNGPASGDVVAVFGNAELGPKAEVSGDVVVVGGTLKRDPAAIVHGDVQNVLSFASGNFDWVRPWLRHCLVLGRPLAIAPGLGWAWGLALGFLGLYVLIALLFRDSVDQCVRTFEEKPGKSILAALLTVVLTPVLFALLFVTVIGIAFVPLAALGLFLIGLFGKAVVLAWIGRSISRLSGERAPLHTAMAVLIGGLLVLVLYLVPFVGFIAYKAIGLLGLGIAMYTLLAGSRQKRGDAGTPPLAPAGGPPGGGGAAYTEPTVGEADVSAQSRSYSAPASGTPFGFSAQRFDEPRAGDSSAGPTSASDSVALGMTGTRTTIHTGTAPETNASAAHGTTAGGPGVTGTGGTSATGTGEEAAAGAGATSSGSGAATAAPGGAGAGATGAGVGGGNVPPGGTGAGGTGAGGTGAGGTGTGGSAGSPPPHAPGGVNSATATTYPRAGFGVRMAALFIDVVLVAVLLGIIDSTKEAELIALATYGAIMWKLKGTTIGGIVFGLQVVRVDGRPIDWATATVRALSCFLSLVVAGLGFIWIAFDEGHQAWHDKIAGTAVVRVPKGVSLL